jgi:DNA-binding response OmpR family regulator
MFLNSSQRARAGNSPEPTATVELVGLGNRFIGLLGRKWSRRSFATEMAKLLVDAMKTKAAAVLGYERQRNRLVLLADHGLSSEARLTLGGGTENAWDIPLRGLRNRRISVIEAAHQNPLIPQSLTKLCPDGLCIVSLPVYYDYEPVGVVVLFAARSRAFPDVQLQTLSQALRVCGRGLREKEGMPAHTSSVGRLDAIGSASAVEAAPALPEPAQTSPTPLRLVEAEPGDAARVPPAAAALSEGQRIEQELARVQAEMQRRSEALRRLMAASRAIKAERDRLTQQVAELTNLRTTETTDLHSQLASVEERLLAAESERLRYQRSADAKRLAAEHALQALQAEHDGLLLRMGAMESNATEVDNLLQALRRERDDLVVQKQDLAQQLEAGQAALEQLRSGYTQERVALEAERDRWKEQVSAQQAQLAQQTQKTAEIQAHRQDLTAARDLLAGQLDSARAEAQRSAALIDERAAALVERDQKITTLRQAQEAAQKTWQLTGTALDVRVAKLSFELEQRSLECQELVAARGKLAQREQELSRDLAAVAAERQDLSALAAELRQQLAESQRTGALRDELIASVRAQLEERTTESQHLVEERAQHLQTAQALRNELLPVRAEIDRLSHDRTAVQQQAAAAQAQCERAEQRSATLVTELESVRRNQAEAGAAADREQAQLRDALQQLTREQQRWESERAERRTKAAAQEETLVQLQALLNQTVAECARVQEALRAAEAAAALAAAESSDLRRAVHNAVQRLEQERLQHASEIEALIEDSAAPAVSADSGIPASDHGEVTAFPVIAKEDGEREHEKPLIIERSAPLAVVAETTTEAPKAPPPPAPPQKKAASTGELVLLDEGALCDQACAALHDGGFEVTAFAPGEATVDELSRRKLKCIMVNLGGGSAAWRTLKMLRERAGTRNVPILAYAMAAEPSMGFCFGRVDFSLWPLDPGRMIERLGRLRPKLQRLLIVSADVEGMGRLREPLARAKISTSIVFDAKQALDFAAMVDPDAAVVHLSPNCPSAARAIASLRANESTRDLPLLVLLDAASTGNDEAFLVNAVRQLLGKPAFQFSRLPEEIGRLIG